MASEQQILKGADLRIAASKSRTKELQAAAEALGAKVGRWNQWHNATNIIFDKGGSEAQWNEAQTASIHILSPSWLDACKSEGKKVNTKAYIVKTFPGEGSDSDSTTDDNPPKKGAKATGKGKTATPSKGKGKTKADEEEPKTPAKGKKTPTKVAKKKESSSSSEGVEVMETKPTGKKETAKEKAEKEKAEKEKLEKEKVEKEKAEKTKKEKEKAAKEKAEKEKEEKEKAEKAKAEKEKAKKEKEKAEKEKAEKEKEKAEKEKAEKAKKEKAKAAPKKGKGKKAKDSSSEETSSSTSEEKPAPKKKKRATKTSDEDESPKKKKKTTKATESPKKKKKDEDEKETKKRKRTSESGAESPVKKKRKKVKASKYLLFSQVTDEEFSELKKAVKKLGDAEIHSTWNSKVTHLVLGSQGRSLKVLEAVSKGIWIVKKDWITKSIDKDNTWQKEDKFEAVDWVEGAKKARTASKDKRIFKGIKFYVGASTPKIDKPYLQEMIKLCGGEIVSTPEGSDWAIAGQRGPFSSGGVVVTVDWLFDALSTQSIPDPTDDKEKYLVKEPPGRKYVEPSPKKPRKPREPKDPNKPKEPKAPKAAAKGRGRPKKNAAEKGKKGDDPMEVETESKAATTEVDDSDSEEAKTSKSVGKEEKSEEDLELQASNDAKEEKMDEEKEKPKPLPNFSQDLDESDSF